MGSSEARASLCSPWAEAASGEEVRHMMRRTSSSEEEEVSAPWAEAASGEEEEELRHMPQ